MKNQSLLTRFYVNNDMAITFDCRTVGTNPFRVLLVPLRPTCGQSMGPKSMGHFGYFPRQYGKRYRLRCDVCKEIDTTFFFVRFVGVKNFLSLHIQYLICVYSVSYTNFESLSRFRRRMY